MKILKTVMLMVALLLVPGYALSANLGHMRISLIEGDVQLKTTEAESWGLASVNMPLAEGDQVWAPQGGRVELQLNTGTYMRLNENSALQILSLDNDASQFYLSQGAAYIYYDAPARSVIQVDTPDASTRAFERAIFRIDMSDQYTDVAVYKGHVETENSVGRTRVGEGQMVSLGQNTDGELGPMGPADEWERWNKARNDRILAGRGASAGYLPAELSVYAHDFDSSGRWVQVPDYGYVWTPTVVVGASWAPYRDGRWIWRGGDYVWVGYESWGWAPYHYGRWSFGVNIGWFWVPPATREVYWSPGYVGWVRTADYVGWVPLAPGETYYGRGHYGRHSVDITNINISQVNINVYKNVNVNNGVTIVNRKTFATASPRIANLNQNDIRQKIFTKNNLSVGTPSIKPTKESFFASGKTVSRAKMPPETIRNIQTKQLKQSRPFVREADKSVFTPGIKPKSLPVNTVTTPRTPGKGKPMIQQLKPDDRKKETAPTGGGLFDRREKQQVKPQEKKPVVPEGGPSGRGKPSKELKPDDRKKETAPTGGGLFDRREKQQVKPEEKKPVVPEGGPSGRGKPSKEQIKPEEKKPSVPEGRPFGRDERSQVKPVEKKPVVPEGGPSGRGKPLKEQIKPEKKKPAELEESPKKDKKKQDEEERRR
ncbi:MAG: FecR domain-containing protein [Nitrospirae bacterium]|nr:FecR domain-containing protein [Nitrospirota bacterium]